MLYTQQQALQVIGLDQSTFVYWMRVSPRLKRLKGRGCHFTQADLLALGTLVIATRDLGCSISWLLPAMDPLFELLASASLASLPGRAIVLGETAPRIEKLPVVVSTAAPCLVIPMRPVVDRVTSTEDQLLPLERLMIQRQ